MQVEIIKPDQLTSAQIAAWEQILRENNALSSPFFRPEFSQIVSRVVKHIEIAVMSHHNELVGFFPYQRHLNRVARPVGSPLSDYQGLIVPEGAVCDIPMLFKQCDLQAFYFDNLICSQQMFTDYHWYQYTTHKIDLQLGYDAYCESKRRSGCSTLKKTQRKIAKLEKSCGPLELVPVTNEESVFATLLQWKREQYQRCGCIDYLALDWVVDLLRNIVNSQQSQFSGMLSALYAGKELIAIHLGLRAGHVLHGWFPVYNLKFARYSPGLILWYELARHANSLGISQIDLAKGNHRFKKSLANSTGVVAEGAIDSRTAIRTLNQSMSNARHFLTESTLGTPLKRVIKATRDWVSSPFRQKDLSSCDADRYRQYTTAAQWKNDSLTISDAARMNSEVPHVS